MGRGGGFSIKRRDVTRSVFRSRMLRAVYVWDRLKTRESVGKG